MLTNFFGRLFPLIDAEGGGGSGGDGDSGAGNGDKNAGGDGNGAGDKNAGGGSGKTYSEEEAERIAKDRAERAEKAALRSYFQQKGYTQKEVEGLIKDHKEKKEKEKTDLQKEKDRADAAEKASKTALGTANQRLIAAEFKVLATQEGIQYVDDALKLADLSSIEVDDKGEVDSKAVKKIVGQLKKDKPFLVGESGGGSSLGSGSKPGGSSGGKGTKGIGERLAERNKASQESRKDDPYFK